MRPSIAASILCCACAASAGPLTPPGAPAPTQKTLVEVEPRIPINSLPGSSTATHVISRPGSYMLTADILGDEGKAGIAIDVGGDNVSIDLMGFEFRGGPSVTNGGVVIINAPEEVVIRNGRIFGWGADAIDLTGVARAELHELRIVAAAVNGVTMQAGVISDCTITQCTGVGVKSTADVVIKGSKIKENFTGAFDLGAGSRLLDSEFSRGGDAGANLVADRCLFVNDIDESVFRRWRFLGGGASLTSNEFRILGADTANLPAVECLGDGVMARENRFLAASPAPATVTSARNPPHYISLDGGHWSHHNNQHLGMHPGTEALRVEGDGGVLEGNTFIGARAGSSIGVLLFADNCLVVGNRFHRLGPTGQPIVNTGSGNVIGPIVTGSTLGANANPDRNLWTP
jgi:hypothetical protein